MGCDRPLAFAQLLRGEVCSRFMPGKSILMAWSQLNKLAEVAIVLSHCHVIGTVALCACYLDLVASSPGLG